MAPDDSTRKSIRRKGADKSPAFQLYTKDLLSDGNVLAMDLPQFGAYVKLLLICWNERGLLDDMDRMARQLHITREHFDQLWIGVAPCFYLEDGRWQQKRLDEERRKQAKYRRAMQLNGRKGGRPGKAAAKPQVSETKADESFAFASSSASSSASAQKKEPQATGKRRVFSGSSFIVTENMQAIIIAPLGKGGDEFNCLPTYEACDAEWSQQGAPADVLGALKLRVRRAFDVRPGLLPPRDPKLLEMDRWKAEAEANPVVIRRA